MTREDMKGFYKVQQDGGTFIVATFFNPETLEVITKVVRDYDYADCSRDDDELYYMPIDNTAYRAWKHMSGAVMDGDTIEVIKGRKVKIGTVAKVVSIKKIYDRYKRHVADYAVLDNGETTNITNCKVIAIA